MKSNDYFDLNDGHKIPVLGFGTYLIPPGEQTLTSIKTALNVGYRLIDTASFYHNEADVGQAIKESEIARDKIFVTTKLWNANQGYDSALRAFDMSLQELQLEYIDLYLIHYPVYEKRIESWKALQTLKQNGQCRSIGVSNFMIPHLQELMDATEIIPAVNQVEFSPFLYQQELMNFCHKHNILVESYCPLTCAHRLKDVILVDIGHKHKKTAAQVLIRWNLQHHLVPLPKSKTEDRIIENFQVFDFNLDNEDMKRLDSLNEDYRTSWDPSKEK